MAMRVLILSVRMEKQSMWRKVQLVSEKATTMRVQLRESEPVVKLLLGASNAIMEIKLQKYTNIKSLYDLFSWSYIHAFNIAK